MPYPPTIPPQTCPLINGTKSQIDHAQRLALRIINESEDDVMGTLADDIHGVLSTIDGALEELRTANAALRECVDYYLNESTALKETNDDLETENEKLLRENEQLRSAE